MPKNTISNSVIRRLPRYYRFLGELEANGYVRISSRELSEKMGLTASQIRQDFNCFGEFGQQGYGYNVSDLRNEMGKILGLSRQTPMILIGADERLLAEKSAALRAAAEKYDRVSFAIGACAVTDGTRIDEALSLADERMYEDKRSYYEAHPELGRRAH